MKENAGAGRKGGEILAKQKQVSSCWRGKGCLKRHNFCVNRKTLPFNTQHQIKVHYKILFKKYNQMIFRIQMEIYFHWIQMKTQLSDESDFCQCLLIIFSSDQEGVCRTFLQTLCKCLTLKCYWFLSVCFLTIFFKMLKLNSYPRGNTFKWFGFADSVGLALFANHRSWVQCVPPMQQLSALVDKSTKNTRFS